MDALLQQFCEQLNKKVRARLPLMAERVSLLVEQQLYTSPTVKELLREGPLAGELGIPKGETDRIREIIKMFASQVVLDHKPFQIFGSNISGSVSLYILEADFDKVCQASEALITTKKNLTFSWMEDLVKRGDEIVVVGWHYLGESRPQSRSSQSIMVPKGIWRVPPEHSGTVTWNFAIRSLSRKRFINSLHRVLYSLIK